MPFTFPAGIAKAPTGALAQTPRRPRSSPGKRRAHGTALVEFAVIAPLFFLLLCGTLEFGRLFYVQTTLQNAVRQAGRYASTGQHQANPANPGTFYSRVQSIEMIAQQQAPGFDLSGLQINGLTWTNPNAGAGGPGEVVTISLQTNLQLITPVIGQFFGSNGTFTFTVNSTFQNEMFPPGQTT
jgi:hypothetical protein